MDEERVNVESMIIDKTVIESPTGTGKEPDMEQFRKTVKLMDLKKSLGDMNSFREKVKKTETALIGEEDDLAHLDEVVSSMTEKQLEALTEEEIDKIYTSSINGKPIEFPNIEKMRELEFKKDFLINKKRTQEILKKIDIEQERFEKEYAESEEEITSLIDKMDDINAGLRAKLEEVYVASVDPEVKEKIGLTIDAMDNAFSLNCIYEKYSTLHPDNQIYDYRTRGKQIYTRFLKKIKFLNLKTDLSMFTMFENRFMDKKFHDYTDLFIFLVFKHILYRTEEPTREWEATFLTQFTINMKKLYDDEMKPEKKEEFLSNIRKLMSLFENYLRPIHKEVDEMIEEEKVVTPDEESNTCPSGVCPVASVEEVQDTEDESTETKATGSQEEAVEAAVVADAVESAEDAQ